MLLVICFIMHRNSKIASVTDNTEKSRQLSDSRENLRVFFSYVKSKLAEENKLGNWLEKLPNSSEGASEMFKKVQRNLQDFVQVWRRWEMQFSCQVVWLLYATQALVDGLLLCCCRKGSILWWLVLEISMTTSSRGFGINTFTVGFGVSISSRGLGINTVGTGVGNHILVGWLAASATAKTLINTRAWGQRRRWTGVTVVLKGLVMSVGSVGSTFSTTSSLITHTEVYWLLFLGALWSNARVLNKQHDRWSAQE